MRKALNFTPRKTFTNFKDAKTHFKRVILSRGVDEYQQTYCAKQPVASAFRQLFPHIVEERGILESQDKNHVNELYDNNQVTIRVGELPTQEEGDDTVDFLAIGGPAAVGAAALAKAGGINKVTHTWYTRRGSNADGSAYYYHIRDAFPVYVNRVNRGPYCLYTDLAKRLRTHASLERWAREDPDYVKIHINWSNILRQPSLIWRVFIPNFIKMVTNIYLLKPEDTEISHVVKHAARAREISTALSKALNTPPLLLRGPPRHSACYAGVTENKDVVRHFEWLSKFAPDDIIFKNVSVEDHALGVSQLLLFPEDGCVSPRVFEDLLSCVDSRQLEKVEEIIVGPNEGVFARFKSSDGSIRRVFADRCVASLGPSANMVDGEGKEIGKTTMWAAGSTSVVLVVVPLPVEKDSRKKVENYSNRFMKFLDSVNQHWTPIESTDFVDAEGKEHLAFALQMTGGGNFPSRYTRPDTVYNLLHNFERIFCNNKTDASTGKIYYDLIQTRSCPRSVTADNTIAFQKVGDRLTLAYGQGGIGMTTLFPNAELALRLAGVERPIDIYESDPLAGLDVSSFIDNQSWEKKSRTVDHPEYSLSA